MKQVGEHAQDAETILLNDSIVSDFLCQNPDFFMRNARQVEQMLTPQIGRAHV